MNKKHNRLLDSSNIQQEPLHKDKVKRNQVSGNIGENMNSEFHEEKVIKEMEFNDEISTMVVDGKKMNSNFMILWEWLHTLLKGLKLMKVWRINKEEEAYFW